VEPAELTEVSEHRVMYRAFLKADAPATLPRRKSRSENEWVRKTQTKSSWKTLKTCCILKIAQICVSDVKCACSMQPITRCTDTTLPQNGASVTQSLRHQRMSARVESTWSTAMMSSSEIIIRWENACLRFSPNESSTACRNSVIRSRISSSGWFVSDECTCLRRTYGTWPRWRSLIRCTAVEHVGYYLKLGSSFVEWLVTGNDAHKLSKGIWSLRYFTEKWSSFLLFFPEFDESATVFAVFHGKLVF